MTVTTVREPKIDTRPDRVAVEGPHAMPDPDRGLAVDRVPALLVEHVTKRFMVGRKRRPVVAIGDVSFRLERGGTIGILGAVLGLIPLVGLAIAQAVTAALGFGAGVTLYRRVQAGAGTPATVEPAPAPAA